ncbi:MAG: flagellar motor protein MotA [Rhodospirillaceae bacterium]
MTRPHTYLIRMLAFLGAVGAVAVLLFPPMREFFLANAALNGLIVVVLILGIAYNFRQVQRLYPEVAWIEEFRRSQQNYVLRPAAPNEVHLPKLLAPMAAMMANRSSLSLSAMSLRSLLDGIASRLDESRDLSRYIIGLLIFLGLLGTFWGLLETVGSISDVIGSLQVDGGDTTRIFSDLKSGLEAPLSGMGTAFSSSLFGLAGSLLLGFLDLQASAAQNRFYNDLEEWLSSVTRLSSGAIGSDGEQGVPAYVQALLEQTAESLENLQRTLARGEESRANADAGIHALAGTIETLTDQMRTEQALMKSLAETQVAMKPILQQIADNSGRAGGAGIDDATQAHVRNLDVHVGRMVDELRTGRDDLVQQIRSEIKLLARTIAAATEDRDR